MKIVAIMPIKLNNERLPGKNTMMLGGKPLLRHELDNLIRISQIDDIYVYCSSEEIKDYLPAGVKFLRRPKELDLPTSNFTQIFDTFSHTIEADIYVYAHATAPFVTVETMRECIDAVISKEYDSAFCAVKIQDYLWQDGKPLNFDAQNLPRSQDIKPIYRETSGIYVIPKEMFTSLRRRVGNRPYIKELTFKESIDINNGEDFELAEVFAEIQ